MAGKLFIGKQFYIREQFEKTQVMKIVNKIFNNDSYIPVGLQKSIKKDKKKIQLVFVIRDVVFQEEQKLILINLECQE
jgi:hypothetical protein